MAPHEQLDNPVWHSLTTRHAHLAQGKAPVLRYPPEASPFAALQTPEALEHLADVIPEGGNAVLWADDTLPEPPGLERLAAFPVMQLVAERFQGVDDLAGVASLGRDDVSDILELTALTRPGPFGPRTIEMGEFVGIWEHGRLIAMAGERMCLPGYTEITAICTHPEFQGRGLARKVMAAVGQRIVAQGRIPFLHSLPDNAAALKVYASAGFVERRMWQVNLFGQAGATSASDGYFAGR